MTTYNGHPSQGYRNLGVVPWTPYTECGTFALNGYINASGADYPWIHEQTRCEYCNRRTLVDEQECSGCGAPL